MAQTYRHIPKWLNRFTYWKFSHMAPVIDKHLSAQTSTPKVAHQHWAQQFQVHLAGPCGELYCPIDSKLVNATPRQRKRIALEYLVETDSRWNNVPGARKVFLALDKRTQKRLDRIWSRRRTEWASLLSNIARDQVAFETTVREKLTGSLQSVGQKFGSKSEGWARQVYARYSHQASFLRGKVMVRDADARRILERQGIQLSGNYLLGPPLIPPAVTAGKPPKERRAIEDRFIFHWFAHAFWNLVRYRDNHDPVPWKSSCKDQCLRRRDKWRK